MYMYSVQCTTCIIINPILLCVPVLFIYSSLLCFGSSGLNDLFEFVGCKQIGHLTRVQHVIDILKELFYYNLYSEREGRGEGKGEGEERGRGESERPKL